MSFLSICEFLHTIHFGSNFQEVIGLSWYTRSAIFHLKDMALVLNVTDLFFVENVVEYV